MLVPVDGLKVPLPDVVQVAVVAPPPIVAVRLAVAPEQIAADDAVTVAGLGQLHTATVAVTLATDEQVLPSVTVTL